MPAKNPWETDTNHLNNKGLDVIHPVDQVDKDHYSRMEDVKSLQEGSITPRPGTSLLNFIAFDAGSFTELTIANVNDSGTTVCVTVGGAVDTYGTPVEFYAAAGFNVKWMTLSCDGPGSDNGTYEFDILSGPTLTTVEVSERLLIQNSQGGINSASNTVVSFPVDIPSGARIGIRIKDPVNDLNRSQCFVMHIYG